jgi:uncharacterized protein (TIGR02996 family)
LVTAEFDDEFTDPHRTLDPDARLALHGELTGDDLLAAVLADPDNDGLRLVYGDWLLEHDDPRGAFIQLQLEVHRSGRYDDLRWHQMRELAADKLPDWCAPLFPALHPESVQFWRGFLWKCRSQDSTIALRDVIGHAMWATVGDLETSDRALIAHRCLRSLVTVRTTDVGLAALSAAEHESRATRLVLHGTGEFAMANSASWQREVRWDLILDIGALRNLRSFATWQMLHAAGSETRRLLASPLGRQLTELEFWMTSGSLEYWPEVLSEHPALRRIAIHAGPAVGYGRPPNERGAIALERDDHGVLRLVAELDPHERNYEAVQIAGSLAQRFPTIELVLGGHPAEELEPMIATYRDHFTDVVIR